jgi:hypothetical protein
LLGTLDENDAALLEEKCFTDPRFFEWVRSVEDELIADYLLGRLPEDERERFQSRYLVNPELRKRLEAVSRRTPVRSGSPFRMRWQAVMVALIMVGCAVSPWLVWRARRIHRVETQLEAVPLALMDVALSPGLAKGAGARQVEFIVPARGRVRLSMELPGRTESIDCMVALKLIDADSRRETAWTSATVRSQAMGNGQAVRVELDSSALRPADYVAEVVAIGGAVVETYPFRVNAAGQDAR